MYRFPHKVSALVLLLILLLDSSLPADGIEPITTGIAVLSAATVSGFLACHEYFKCKWYECCDRHWIQSNNTGDIIKGSGGESHSLTHFFSGKTLKAMLERKLYGQHLVIDTLSKAIEAHLTNSNPTKALVMSFHGWTGGTF